MKILDALNDKENNFTLIRLLAAAAVLYGHSYDLSQGSGGADPISHLLSPYLRESLPGLAVDLFFVASGFLVTASYCQRNNLIAFIEARALRIFPALIASVSLCVFIIGPLFTTDTLHNYFYSPSTWSYFKHNTTLASGVQFDLPSVFIHNPYPISVNGSLWTLPLELRMYFCVAILGSLALLKDNGIYNATLLLLCLVYTQSNNDFYLVTDPRNVQLALLFLLGGFFYINRESIPLSITGFVVLCLSAYFSLNTSFYVFLKSICFSYLVLLIALHPKFRLPSIDHWGDISYGLYIYAFPVQQSFAHLIPGISPAHMVIYSSVITTLLALISWHLIERPALKMKGKLRFGRHKDDIRVV